MKLTIKSIASTIMTASRSRAALYLPMTLAAICSRRRSVQGLVLTPRCGFGRQHRHAGTCRLDRCDTPALDNERQSTVFLRSTQQEVCSIWLLPAMAFPFPEMISIRPCDARKRLGVAENAGLADVLPVRLQITRASERSITYNAFLERSACRKSFRSF